jgi:DNA-binding Lrp family transcriptional regulator
MGPLDEIDRRILVSLQKNARLTSAELSEALNLSASQASRRRQRLEADGMIRDYTARVDAAKVGLNVQAFIQVSMTAHSANAATSFLQLVELQPEIVSVWTLTGQADYLLRVYCADLDALNRLVQKVLLPHEAVLRVETQIVMKQIKADAPLPA